MKEHVNRVPVCVCPAARNIKCGQISVVSVQSSQSQSSWADGVVRYILIQNLIILEITRSVCVCVGSFRWFGWQLFGYGIN